jgi:DNA-binding PadR family transcriptional regulator
MNAHHHYHDDHHAGWVRPRGRRGRWLEPFVLLILAEGETYGWAVINRLNGLGVAPDGVDVGMAYRTLREFEAEGLVESAWVADTGPPRRTYALTDEGRLALHEWSAVMRERGRLIDAFIERAERLGRGQGRGQSQGG